MKKYDSHNHSAFSHDAVCTTEELCKAAIAAGLDGIVISDHFNIPQFKGMDSTAHIVDSVKSAKQAAKDFAPRLALFTGVELGEAVWNKANADIFIGAINPDVVLSSVHAVRFEDVRKSFSRIDFSEWDTEQLDGYMQAYFRDMQEMVECMDMDILPHLDNPLKYMNGRYNKGMDTKPYCRKIDRILNTVIERRIALELNVSQIGLAYDNFMPTLNIMARYKELGGTLVTIGSDAHHAERVGINFDKGAKALYDLGFREYHYFKNREPYAVKLEG